MKIQALDDKLNTCKAIVHYRVFKGELPSEYSQYSCRLCFTKSEKSKTATVLHGCAIILDSKEDHQYSLKFCLYFTLNYNFVLTINDNSFYQIF